MQRLHPSGWSFATRLLTLALAPAFVMLIVVNASLYVVSRNEAQADVRERGRVAAAALAEGSRYGVISGNLASIERAVQGLFEADRSIVKVEVLGNDGRPLVAIQRGRIGSDAFVIEAPITAGSLDVDLLDPASQRAAAPSASSPAPERRLAGLVRVTMSPAPLLDAKRYRLFQGSLLVLLACAIAAAVALALARRLRQPLNAVMAALRQVRQGTFDVRLEHTAGGELGELQLAIVEMAKGLGKTHQQLEEEVARRTAELSEAMQALQAADTERRRLIARGNELVEEERRRLSLEIHDEFNAALVSVRLQATAMSAKAADEGNLGMQQAADRIAALTDNLYRRARAIVTQLRPEVIDTLGLSGAIEEMVRQFDEVHANCRFELHVEGRVPVVPDAVAIAAYRAVQEALSNVAKHSQASLCRVLLASVDLEGRPSIRLDIQDNGRGYDPRHVPAEGVGLIGMRERVAALSGILAMESSPDAGTTVTIRMPLDAAPRFQG